MSYLFVVTLIYHKQNIKSRHLYEHFTNYMIVCTFVRFFYDFTGVLQTFMIFSQAKIHKNLFIMQNYQDRILPFNSLDKQIKEAKNKYSPFVG